jgi:D-arginine dehydrogenase
MLQYGAAMVYDFLIVGAGIAGASAAYGLAQSTRVCLIEAESRPGFHATSRSAALFAPSYGGREFRALTRASRPFFDNPPPGFSDQPLLHPRGCLYIARSDQREALRELVESIRATGGDVSYTDLDHTFASVPSLRRDYVVAAAEDREAMDIEVDGLHQGFLRGAKAAGATLVTNSPVARAERRGGLWHIPGVEGEISAPVLINAAGAWADELAQICGARPIGLQPLRRTALLVEGPPGVDIRDWPAVIDTEEQFYFKPDAGKLLLSPADETPARPGDAYPEELDVAIAVDRVQAALDIDIQRVSHSWAGLRTFSPDRNAPVVGFDGRVENFFWCAGQGGYGIQTAPAMSALVAALAKREMLPPGVLREGLTEEALSPQRFTPG